MFGYGFELLVPRYDGVFGLAHGVSDDLPGRILRFELHKNRIFNGTERPRVLSASRETGLPSRDIGDILFSFGNVPVLVAAVFVVDLGNATAGRGSDLLQSKLLGALAMDQKRFDRDRSWPAVISQWGRVSR